MTFKPRQPPIQGSKVFVAALLATMGMGPGGSIVRPQGVSMIICPGCGARTPKILVCEPCWKTVPPRDRMELQQQYFDSKGKPKPEICWKFKAAKIVKELRERRADQGLPCPPLAH